MALKLCKLLPKSVDLLNSQVIIVRHGHHIRGKPPGVAKTLQQRLEEFNYKDPAISFRVDIGLPPSGLSRAVLNKERLEHLKKLKNDPEYEKLARTQQLKIDLDEAKKVWLETVGPSHKRQIADHYGIFDHLFGDAYFFPRVAIQANYASDEYDVPVYYGNIVKPHEAKEKPEISFESDPNSLWTLILTNPDGHLTKQDSEYVHWFVGNIPGNKINDGETIVDYLRPFPPRGTGFHRFVFILYKQEGPVDYSTLKKEGPCLNLLDRTFSTLEFYRPRQDLITPAGLVFFQSDWDQTVTKVYHEILNMREPIFEYDFPPSYHPPQEWFPIRQAFNLYMDRYRDPKQINKEFLLKKLKKIDPFKGPEPELPYPNVIPIPKTTPSWLKTQIMKERNKWGRINEIVEE